MRVFLTSLAAFALASTAQAQPAERSGEQVVKAQCVKCHGSGANGAPKIGDRAAWTPRLKQGVDATVRSAINGHGKMPARGGMANLTDAELRAAILYMYNPAGGAAKGAAAPRPALADPHRKVVDGIEINLGIAPAQSKGSYHVNISLRDQATQAQIKDATVEARVASPLGGTTRKLAPSTVNDAVSYGNDFSVAGNEPYTITVQVRRPGASRPSEASFEFRP